MKNLVWLCQVFNDRKHGFLTHAPKLQRSSQRILLALAILISKWSIYLRDITQAYTQSATTLRQNIFLKPAIEFVLSNEMVIRVNRPLYGVPEAGLHCFKTYHKFHTSELNMKSSAHDLCLLYTKNTIDLDNNGKPAAATCLQTDSSLFLANTQFENFEAEKSKKFER